MQTHAETPLLLTAVRLGESPVDYEEGWALQRAVHAEVVAGRAPDTVLLLEHEPVFTAGRRTSPSDRPVDGSRVVDVDRGGRITWHGPGQLVGYPIVRLAEALNVVGYVRRLEQALINACAQFGLATDRIESRSGVWVRADEKGPDRKVAAIGIRVAQGVTMHGFALNCDPDMSWFTRIVPCGIEDAGVTCLSWELGRTVGIAEVLSTVQACLASADLPGVHEPRIASATR